ncbi:MAG: F420-nonreducing hydrogenase [Candidatus Bathyarchaeia archaeon]
MAKILIAGLAGDSGCQVATLALHERLLQILSMNELVYASTLIDSKQIPGKVDVAVIEGGVRTEHEKHLAEEIRRKSRTVITLGSCACFGGIPGLANLKEGGELLRKVYADLEGTIKGHLPGHDTVIPYVAPIGDIIEVDYSIPGCPPEVEDIAYVLTTLLEGKTPTLSKSDVCDDCKRERLGTYEANVKRLHESHPDPNRCLLEQGFLCMGPATRGGCGAPCPAAGHVCDGCRGPTEKNDDQGLTMLDALVGLVNKIGIDFSMPQHSGSIYRYTFASSKVAKLLRERVKT